ncbi:hypothetical protein ANN_10782 [Periplaneta americana]|uniref:Reverse transcriptase domain-containing protein n=1 Tax=Periplaneta americana TaxID=6978 RepID=A0ABQ8T3X1_PERAM|nr:hypothetical protein ANN_10782 [Periplaneta americana]
MQHAANRFPKEKNSPQYVFPNSSHSWHYRRYRTYRSLWFAFVELDSGKKCLGVFLDIQKAFDTVDHNILTSKLHAYGIKGIALNLFKSYLSNRSQLAKFNDQHSEIRNINIGVPQVNEYNVIIQMSLLNIMQVDRYAKLADGTYLSSSNQIVKIGHPESTKYQAVKRSLITRLRDFGPNRTIQWEIRITSY